MKPLFLDNVPSANSDSELPLAIETNGIVFLLGDNVGILEPEESERSPADIARPVPDVEPTPNVTDGPFPDRRLELVVTDSVGLFVTELDASNDRIFPADRAGLVEDDGIGLRRFA